MTPQKLGALRYVARTTPEQRSARARRGGIARKVRANPGGATMGERLAAGGEIARVAAVQLRRALGGRQPPAK